MSVSTETIKDVATLKARCSSQITSWTSIRQKIEDRLAAYSGDLDPADVTKIQAGINKIQDILDAVTSLQTALNNNFPEIE